MRNFSIRMKKKAQVRNSLIIATTIELINKLTIRINFCTVQINRWQIPIPSASSKIFWQCSKFFDHLQYFLNVFKYFWPCSNMQIHKLQSHFCQWSKTFECVQKILNLVKKIWTQLKYFWTSRWNRHKAAHFCLVSPRNQKT